MAKFSILRTNGCEKINLDLIFSECCICIRPLDFAKYCKGFPLTNNLRRFQNVFPLAISETFMVKVFHGKMFQSN